MTRPAARRGGRTVRVLGRAKINLSLSLRGLRPDGYHDLEMVMQAVDLADELTMTPAPAAAVMFRWFDGLAGEEPTRPDLVERAVEEYRRRTGGAGARVEVRKRIPLASGMAGGSADAAAALVGMDTLNGGQLASELPQMAAALGSDVPFALAGGTCVARGRGERLEPVPCPTSLWWVLGISRVGISTPEVFRRYDVLASGRADGPLMPEAERWSHGALLAALASGEPRDIAALLRNDLVPAARDVEPDLGRLEEAMRAAGVLGAVVSGSGPTVAGLCRDEAHAREVAARAGAAFDRVEVVASARSGAEVLACPPGGGLAADAEDEGH
jgi:4-diphosphocytidyl-2-C-methyl-D-erythritol kinase